MNQVCRLFKNYSMFNLGKNNKINVANEQMNNYKCLTFNKCTSLRKSPEITVIFYTNSPVKKKHFNE